ncbi:MAG: hypothetical protein KDC12_15545 [Flavobacteriales bacterium]|nr:hypothetical protein [Flavobacteriales bacterium]
MKKLPLLLVLWLLCPWAYGQDHKATVDQFFELVHCQEVLSRGFMGIEAFVASQKEALFKEYELDVHNPTDVATFDSLLHERMQMFERNAYVRLHERYVYDYPPEQVEGYLALANGSSEEDILRASNFRQEVDSLITYFQP